MQRSTFYLVKFGLVLGLSALAACGQGDGSSALEESAASYEQPILVRLPLYLLTPEFVQATGFNREHQRDDEYAFGYLSRASIEALPKAQAAQLMELDPWAFARGLIDAKTLQLRPEALADGKTEDTYHNYDALTSELKALAGRFPDIASLRSAGLSVQGREMWYIKISDHAASDEAEPKMLLVANMHGDEVVGRELSLHLISVLLEGYSQEARIKSLVDNAQIFIMPSMNPDGFELKRRYNARGIDLNRDFPDFTSDPVDTPQGRAVETLALMRLANDNHFVLSANFHGGEVCFNMPWDTQPNDLARERFGDDALMQVMARRYADLNPTMRANSGGSFDRGVTYGYEWYEVDGGLQDWAIYYRQSIHATLELSYAKWPQAAELSKFRTENTEAVLRYLEQGLSGIHLKVVDKARSPLQQVSLRVASANREVSYPSGVQTRPTLPGAQRVTVAAPGYQTREIELTPWKLNDNALELVLPRTDEDSP